MQSREETASRVLQETGAVLLHPYNDKRIIRYYGEVYIVFHTFQLRYKATQYDIMTLSYV